MAGLWVHKARNSAMKFRCLTRFAYIALLSWLTTSAWAQMVTLHRGIIGVVALLLASTIHTFGIEGLKLQIHCPDVVLSWPSVEGENYIVQWREDLSTNSTWVTLTNLLPAEIGTNLTAFVHSNSDLRIFLKNNIDDPLTATNRHPFRFVFLDGCNTADGKWPQAFGIPKKKGMVITDFTQKRGIRPRAFMGWNRSKAIGTGIISGGSMNPAHGTYVSRFWDYWGNGPTGLRPVEAAIDQAKSAAPGAAGGMMLYGAKDLVINY